MTVKIRNAAARAANDAINAQIDQGSAGQAKLNLYGGSRPASVATAVSGQTLLCSFDLPNPLFPASTAITGGASATANSVPDATAVATGTATWGRVLDRDGAAVMDLDVTDTAGSGDAKLANVSLVTGVEVRIVSWTASHPE